MDHRRSAPALSCALLVAVAVSGTPAHASDDKIAAVSAQIAKQPNNAALLILRAQLHREDGDHESALADLDLAATLPGAAVAANLAAGETLHQMGKEAAAIEK